MVDMVTAMNLNTTIAYQENKCLKCNRELPTSGDEQIYFIMIQKKNIYEVYCEDCGHIKEKEDN